MEIVKEKKSLRLEKSVDRREGTCPVYFREALEVEPEEFLSYGD